MNVVYWVLLALAAVAWLHTLYFIGKFFAYELVRWIRLKRIERRAQRDGQFLRRRAEQLRAEPRHIR